MSQGTRELGIRLALGAAPRDVLLLVVRHGMSVAVTGMALGLAGALVLTRFMRALLFGVQASDPVTFVSIAAMLASVALAACYVPARRAAQNRSDCVAAGRSRACRECWPCHASNLQAESRSQSGDSVA